ncbi:MAG TPA: ATP-binding protein [Puia sp.]|nr:ATP-binding protein [Puia sp.]
MSQRLRSLILLFFYLLQFLLSKEQTSLPGYSVINYNSDNALPQNSINDMDFDRNGFLWLATEMGFVRFDGRNFREYNTRNSPALSSNRCSLINLAEGSGQILFETWFGSHRILTVTADYQLKEDSVLSANPHQHNRSDNRLFSFARIYKKWAGGPSPSPFKELLNTLEVNGDLVTVNERQAYVRKDSSYYYLDESTAGIHLLSEITGHVFKIQFMVGDVYIFVDRQNRLYAYKAGRLQKEITASTRLREFLSQTEVTGPYPMQANLKAIRDTTHTFLVNKGNILLLHIRDGQLDFEVLAANTSIRSINCLIYDEGYRVLYVGTATSGLYILKKHEFGQLLFTSDNYAINSLYAQVELPDGRILTSSGILDRHSKVNNPSPGIYDRPAFLRSSDGYIWYSSYDSLKKIDTGLHRSVTVTYMGSELTSITEADNKSILYSGEHQLFSMRGKEVTTLLNHPALLHDANIQIIRKVSSNDLWIGTASGLFSYDLTSGALSRLPELESASVRAIYKARDESIWIGTYGQGFYKYVKGRFLKMPMDPRSNLSSVHCFMEDKQGYFWLPTNKGLFRVAKKELDSYASGNTKSVFYYYFDKSFGYTSNEFNGGCTPCGIVTRDGHFSLPSLDGLVLFNPDSIPVAFPDQPIFIDRFITDDKKAAPSDRFEHGQDSGPLVFAISSPYFGNQVNLHLEYSIPELDNRWHPVNDDGKLVLTGLHKGRYTLTIRKQEPYARYSYQTARWTILPYWYERTWFRLLVAVVAISILPFIFWLRYTRQVKRAEQLEHKVAERTQALSESNQVKEKMIAIILHDLRSPLRFLHMLAIHISENYQKVTRPELAEMLLKFRNATHELYEFAQDFLVWTNAQKEGFVVRQEKIILREIVGEIVSLYEPGANIRNNIVLNLAPAAITLVSDTHILKLLIRNLVDNANKYTVNGEIKIEAVQDKATVRIIITDTGRSMEKDLVAEILNNTYQAEDDSHGFGYKIILELLARIQGQLTIDTPGNTGNRITLLFRTG